MKQLLALLILINCHLIQGVLEWTVAGKVTDYGQNVTLFCHVPNCCPKDAGWDRWTPVQQTLFIDVKTGHNNKKYDGKAEKDGYTLVIQNLTKEDLNVSYSCLYDVTFGPRKFLFEEDVFTDKSDTTPIDNSRFSEIQIAGIIIGIIVPVAVAVVFFVILLLKKRKTNDTRELVDEPLLPKDCFLEDPSNVWYIEGEYAILTCKVRLTSLPVEWFKDGIAVKLDENNTKSVEGTKHILSIKHVKSDDSGEYCVKVGNFSRKIQLIIKDCFLEDPSNVGYIEGEDAILICKVSPTSLPVKWFKDGNAVELADNCVQSNEGTKHILSIKHAKSDDSGEYCVKVGNFSRKLQLKIKDCFLEDPSNVEYIEGEDAILTCKVRPTSLPVEWFKDGNAVELDDNCEQSNEGTKHILSIKHAKSDDSGEYIVNVGNFSQKIHLKIKDCFLEDPSNVEYIEGEDAKLICKVSPTRLPVEWFKEGNAVKLDENCEQSNKGTKHILIIKHVKSDDSGEYWVKVGNFSRKIQLKIKDVTMNHDEVIPKHIQVNPDHADHVLPFTGTSEEFSKLLSTGTYESFENRVFLCGSCACGKSTLASVLIGSTIPLTWKSTDGLVIHFGRNGINLETFEMVPLHGEDRGQNVLTKVIIGKPTREPSLCQSSDTHIDQHIATSPIGTDSLESSPKSFRNEAGNNLKDSQLSDACLTKSHDLPITNAGRSEIKNTPSISLPKMKKIEAYTVHDDILNEVKSGQYTIKIAPSDLVDFGGQRSYDMTHQLFVQHGGTFVIMFDGSRDFHEPLKEYPTGNISSESIVRHWVNSILTYCVDDSDVMPMIVFAATHRDLISEDLQKKNKADFVKKVTDMFGSHERKKHFVFDPVFFINGTDKNDQEIQNLKRRLVTIARNQPSWGLRRPMIWVPLELVISNMKKDNVNIIFKSHLAEANKMNGDLSLSDKQLDDFLLTQHALGKIMYFNQPELNNFIILYPPALVNILRSFITDEMFWPEEETLRNILKTMTYTGKIYKKDLLELWQQNQVHIHIPDDDFKEFMIRVLIHLDVLVLPKRHSDKNNTHVDYYLVPCTVKEKMPMSFLDDKSFANRTLSLVYKLQQSYIPSALSFKLIGAVSGIWPVMELNGRPLLYHSSAVLSVDGKTEFRMIVEDTKVIVYLTHMSSKSSISPDIAASIQECLTATLEVVLKFYLSTIGKSHQVSNLSNLFQIEVGEVCSRPSCMVSISKEKLKSDWVCDSGMKHSSRYLLIWVFDKKQEECPPTCPGLAKTILPTSPSEQHLSRFATQLSTSDCRKLVMHLGLQQRDWEDIENCYGGMYIITKIMALHFWKTQKIKGKPTKSFSNLLDALIAIDNQQHLLCKVFREDTELLGIADVRLQQIPHDDVLYDLRKNLGNCAIQLGIELGVTMSSINETMVRYHKDMYNQISDILKKWKSSREIKPTIYRLMLALERVDTGGLDYLKNVYLGQ